MNFNASQRVVLTACGVLLAATAAAVILLQPFSGGDGRRAAVHYGGDVRDRVSVIAVVNGVEITDAHWHMASLQHAAVRGQSAKILSRVGESGGFPLQMAAYNELVQRTEPDAITLAAVLMDAALLAEIDNRDLNPPAADIQRALATSRELAEKVAVSTPGRETDEIGLIVVSALPGRHDLVEAVGEEVFEAVLEPALWHLSLGMQALRQEFMIKASSEPPDALTQWREFRLGLVRDGEIEVRRGFPVHGCEGVTIIRECQSFNSALRFLEDYTRIVP